MGFIVLNLSLEMIAAVRPLVRKIGRQDRSLADQLMRAASSVALNVAEGGGSHAGNQKARFFTALGSASESVAALQVAVAWGYLSSSEIEPAHILLRRVLGALWKLVRR